MNFQSVSAAFAQNVSMDNLQPVRSDSRDENGDSDSVHQYFVMLSIHFPCLFFIYTLLSKCSSSEAETERYFSHESLVHSFLRNRLKHDAVCAFSLRVSYLISR